jgi:hypothetical protein
MGLFSIFLFSALPGTGSTHPVGRMEPSDTLSQSASPTRIYRRSPGKTVIDGNVAASGSTHMTLKELADKLAALDEDAFVAALQLEYTHDDEPGQVKAMMIDALRFAEAHGMKAAQPPLDAAD